jgi:MscS family membrane protein
MIDVPAVLRNTLTRSVCLFSALVCAPVWAQFPLTQSAHPAAQADTSRDALGRSTPRGTVLGFLVAARKGNMAVASQFLNTPLRGQAAESLAWQLFTVMDRRLPPRLQDLSDSPEGSLSDLRADEDVVGTISSAQGNVEVMVERVSRDKSVSLWLFSRETLDRIPALYEEINVKSIDSVLPPSC